MKIQQMIERLDGNSEIGVSRAVSDMLFEEYKDAHLATPSLVEVYRRFDDVNIKIDCLIVLGKIGTEESLRFVSEQLASNSPPLLLGAALGFAHSGRLHTASAIYYKLLDSEAQDAVGFANMFTSYFTPVPRDTIVEEKLPSASSESDNEMPQVACEFFEGAWQAQLPLAVRGSDEIIDVRFFNSTNSSGPDGRQLETLKSVQEMQAERWEQIHSTVIEWIKRELMGDDRSDELVGEVSVVGISIPRQWDGLGGSFAIDFESDWELEHGLEVFVMSDGRILVEINDQIASKLYWNEIVA